MSRKFILLAAVVMCAAVVSAYDKSEYTVRPWEIINGMQPHSKLLWDVEKNGISGIRVSGKGKLSTTSLTKLWGEKVAKLDLPATGSVTLRLAKPIIIQAGEGDGLDLYIFGPAGSRPKIDFMLRDANNMVFRMPTSGLGSTWANRRWWGLAAGVFPANVKFPVKLTAIRFSRFTNRIKNDYLCFDRLGVYKDTPVKMLDSSKLADVPFPTTADGIMPVAMAPGAENKVSSSGNKYTFAYQGKDAAIAYTYIPKSGTLSDLSVTINGETFQPAVNGGIRAEVGSVKFMPGNKNIAAKLLKKSFDGKRLATVWQWRLDGAEFKYELNFSIKGKSLAVEVKALTPGGRAFDPGFTRNTPNPRLFGFTYLHNRWDYPHFLATDKYFMSIFCDWYFTNAFELWESIGMRGLEKARVISKDSARLMSGTVYLNKTDGSYNDLYERFYITVSPEVHDVMPHIPNPPSKFLAETANLVCCTRSYPLQGNPKHCDMELDMWKKLYAYGVTDTFVRTHTGLLRTPIESNNIAYQLEGSYWNGGDATSKKLAVGMSKLTKRFGFYGDNRVVSAFNEKPFFSFGALSKMPDNTYSPGCGDIFRPKPSVQREHQKIYVEKLLKKYPTLNGQYMDELTNAPPWADIDADYRAPGAGKLAAVHRDYGLVALQQKELFNGPVWSEGCAAYFWAGLMDIDYAVSNDTKAGLPLIVDFKLMRMNKLSSFTGADWPILRDYKSGCDYLIANEIACGNIGHLGQSGDGMMIWQGAPYRMKNFEPVLKSYFMIRQVQEFFAGTEAVEIKYFINGKFMTASEMLKGNFTPSGKIYARYPNGLETWVNHNKSGNWIVKAGGKEYVLPPFGHVAINPGKLLQYSALVNGKHVDYSRGRHFIYVNGRGNRTDFPEITASHSYVIRNVKGKKVLTPTPFVAAENVIVKNTRTAQALKQDFTVLADEVKAANGFKIDKKAFHYAIK